MALNYREMFDQVTAEIRAKQAELGACLKKGEQLEDEITGLQQTASGLAKTLGEQYVADDAIGLTEAIRRIFRQQPDRPFIPTEIRDALDEMGYATEKYGNIVASIHSVIKRILGKDIEEAGKRHDGRVAYKAKRAPVVSKAPPPPRSITG